MRKTGLHTAGHQLHLASYDQALVAVGAPEHTYRDSERCDGKWLVLDFSWRTGPACGDSTDPACSSRLGDRWFFRVKKTGWESIIRTSAGGCQDVQLKEPAFPSSLCESLAPLSPLAAPEVSPAVRLSNTWRAFHCNGHPMITDRCGLF
ncbi:hypothetical protein [Streptomyces chartreusis]|uniref:hypothetical protein n=1 Tax=Streptomyces chartreusis TaxID=1969 RepID=UPI0036277831